MREDTEKPGARRLRQISNFQVDYWTGAVTPAAPGPAGARRSLASVRIR